MLPPGAHNRAMHTQARRRRITGRATVLALLLLLVTGTASAGSFSLFGSWWDQGDISGIGGWGLRMTRGEGGWIMDLSLGFFRNRGQTGDPAFPWEGKVSVKPLEFGLRYTSPYPHLFRPYAGGGFSYNYLNVSPGSANNMWGWYAVGGFYLGNIRTVDFMAEVLYRGSNSTKITIREDERELSGRVDLGGWALNMGVTFHF